MLDTITLTVAGRPLPHTSCRLTASAEKAVREASFDVAWNGAGLPCEDDAPCVVAINDTLWLTGFVRDVNWMHDEGDRSYTVAVVSRTVDATEASIDHPTGFVEDCDLSTLAKAFDTGGIGVTCDVATDKKALHQIRLGETLYDTLETDARANGALIYDTPDGKLKITNKPEGRQKGALVRGRNILSASGTLSGRFNYSEVKVRGQASYGTKATVLSPEAKATGTSPRKRPLIIYHEGEVTSERMKKRAAWEAKRAAGAGKKARIQTPGCRDAGGQLYAPNFLVSVQDDWGGLDQDMLIASVTFEQDSLGGTITSLDLKDPRALGGENPRGKSAKGWAAPAVPVPTFREDLP